MKGNAVLSRMQRPRSDREVEGKKLWLILLAPRQMAAFSNLCKRTLALP